MRTLSQISISVEQADYYKTYIITYIDTPKIINTVQVPAIILLIIKLELNGVLLHMINSKCGNLLEELRIFTLRDGAYRRRRSPTSWVHAGRVDDPTANVFSRRVGLIADSLTEQDNFDCSSSVAGCALRDGGVVT